MAKRIYDAEVAGRRGRGRQTRVWMDGVKESLIYTKLVWEGGEGTREHGKQGIKLQGCLTITIKTITTTTKLYNNKKIYATKIKIYNKSEYT